MESLPGKMLQSIDLKRQPHPWQTHLSLFKSHHIFSFIEWRQQRCAGVGVCVYAHVSMITRMKVLSSLFFTQLDASILHKLSERKATRFFHRLLQPMFMKQDICSAYFQTQFKSGSNVPEPADHHTVCKSLLPRWSKHLLGLRAPLQWGGGRGCLDVD